MPAEVLVGSCAPTLPARPGVIDVQQAIARLQPVPDPAAVPSDPPPRPEAPDDPGPPAEIIEALEVTTALVAAFERLTPQLSSSNPPPSAEALEEIVASPASMLLLAIEPGTSIGGAVPVDPDAIVGSLTLAVFPIPTGLRAWIEDVVVDGAARGRGVGETLNRAALDLARSVGARTVDLTSRPSREAANRLYQRIGFVARDTNVYRYDLR